jgi:putative ABC transport system permease protein
MASEQPDSLEGSTCGPHVHVLVHARRTVLAFGLVSFAFLMHMANYVFTLCQSVRGVYIDGFGDDMKDEEEGEGSGDDRARNNKKRKRAKTVGLFTSPPVHASPLAPSHPLLGIPAAFCGGALAGIVTGLLQTKLGVHPILAGILTMSGLYSVNLFAMGSSSNLSLIGKPTIFSLASSGLKISLNGAKTGVSLAVCLFSILILSYFFKTHLGLCIRATGSNEDMVRASSINVDAVKIITLAVANACIALSGAVIAQYQGFADISSGSGMVVIGLASVIIGELFFGRRSVTLCLISAVAGSVAYRIVIAVALRTNIFPAFMLKLVSAVIVAAALSIPAFKNRLQLIRMKKEGGRHS